VYKYLLVDNLYIFSYNKQVNVSVFNTYTKTLGGKLNYEKVFERFFSTVLIVKYSGM
jgi:hypothetical protein